MNPNPKGKFKVCQEKHIFGKNGPPVYYKNGQTKQPVKIKEKYWKRFGYEGSKRKHSKGKNVGSNKRKRSKKQ